MSIAKKLLVILLIVTILMPLFPCKVLWAANNVEAFGQGELDEEQYAYLSKYVRKYVEIAMENDFVFYGFSGNGWKKTYHQNDEDWEGWANDSRIGETGAPQS